MFVLFLFIKPVLLIFFSGYKYNRCSLQKCEKYQEKIPERYTVLSIAFLVCAQAADVVLKNRVESQIVPGTKQTPPLSSCVVLNKLNNLFEPQFSQLKVGIKRSYRVVFRIKCDNVCRVLDL